MSVEVETNGVSADDYNQKIISKSTWITKEFLKPVLKEKENAEDIIIEDIHVCAAVGAGDNYLSFLYRTTVDYRRSKSGDLETCHLMIKGPPTNEFMLKFIEDFGVFRKELNMYNMCLPTMRKIQNEYLESSEFIAPDSYPCDRKNTLIMEDLKGSDYKMANRMEQLDYDNIVETLKSLARFHALSVIVKQRHPDIIDSVSEEAYTEANRETMSRMCDTSMPIFLEPFRNKPGFENIVRKLELISKNPYDKIIESVKSTPGKFNVLNHGDLWTNNMLFRYDEKGRVEHVKLVDFQLSRYASPALDLYYFFFTSPKPDVLNEKWDDLLEAYHNALTSDLKQLNVDEKDIISMEELQEHLKRKAFFGFYTISTLLPVITANPNDAVDMDTIKEEDLTGPAIEDNPFLKYYRNASYIEKAVKYLKTLERLGLLDEAIKSMQYVDDKLAV